MIDRNRLNGKKKKNKDLKLSDNKTKFRSLLERCYSGEVRRASAILHSKFPGIKSHDREDIIHNYLMSVEDSMDRFSFPIIGKEIEDTPKLRGFMNVILSRRADDYFRRIYTDRKYKEKLVEEVGLEDCYEDNSVEENEITGIKLDILSVALRSLNTNHRRLLMGYHFEGKSYRELADEFDVTVGTLGFKMNYARNCLAQKLSIGGYTSLAVA
ncbi:sigma-70 family RNA polymerase sigma factor [Candidatus Pacearchaeota archaeon]|nr:sigma-70 family RNA polymerase sigma factor [Candidatus Pacearchaeota archaeon]